MLDEATKQKVQAIMEELKTNLASLGVTFPEKGDKFSRLLANLDEDTKAKAQELIEEAKEKLAELGVDHLPHRGF